MPPFMPVFSIAPAGIKSGSVRFKGPTGRYYTSDISREDGRFPTDMPDCGDLSDSALLTLTAEGDNDAFETLVHRYNGLLLRFVGSKIRNLARADDSEADHLA